MPAIGYIRQSRRADLDVALSSEQQQADIDELARRNGQKLAALYSDLGRSGGHGKERRRSGYQEMVAALEAGGVDDLYTKTLTRLGRSVTELYRVLRIAEAQGTRIVTMKEGVMDPGTPIGKAQFGMLAVFAEFERDLAVERARDNAASRRARGEQMGRRWYGERSGESADTVLAAYGEAGSYNGAATILNGQGVPSALGRKWTGGSVRNVVEHHAPALMPRHPARGVAKRSSFALARLLRCHCGRMLTGYHHKQGRIVRYKCHAAETDRTHGQPYSLSESAVLPWIRAEADRYALPTFVATEQDPSGERAVLEAERSQVTRLGAVPGADLDFVAARLAEIESKVVALEDEIIVEQLGPIDWTNTPVQELNAQLRAYWHHVQLDREMRPESAVWRIARMRTA